MSAYISSQQQHNRDEVFDIKTREGNVTHRAHFYLSYTQPTLPYREERMGWFAAGVEHPFSLTHQTLRRLPTLLLVLE